MKLAKKQERLNKSRTRDGLDEIADEKERNRIARGEATRLTQFMKRGGQLMAERVEGVGLVYRSRCRSTAPFSQAAVEKWCARSGQSLPDPAT